MVYYIISAQLASLASADATAPCGARLRGRSGERGALRAASTQQTRTAAKQLLYVLLTFTTQLALIAIATLSALYVNFTQTLHKRSMAATSDEGSSLDGCSGLPAPVPKITASFSIAPHTAETQVK